MTYLKSIYIKIQQEEIKLARKYYVIVMWMLAYIVSILLFRKIINIRKIYNSR